MATEQALIKILETNAGDLNHFLSAFPTQLLLRTRMVKGTSGGATDRIEYIGYALSDTTLAQPRWLIKKMIYDSSGFQIDAVFANGEMKFNKIFDAGSSEWASYTYSVS